jgi:hypothetical protein
LLFASDKVQGRPSRATEEYLHQAIEQVIELRTRMADSLGDEALRLPARASRYFNRASATSCGEECGR